VTGDGGTRSRRRRIPAGDLEAIVISRLRALLSNRGELLDAISGEDPSKKGQGQLLHRGREIAEELGQAPDKIKAVVMTLIRRVELRPDVVKIEISQGRLLTLLTAPSPDLRAQKIEQSGSSDRTIILTTPAQLKRIGREMKLLVDSDSNKVPDIGLLRILARAHDIQMRLAQDTSLTVHDVAHDERVSAAYIYVLLRLRWLAPDVTTAIVNGRQPSELNAKKLMRLTAHLPPDWADQRASRLNMAP
jgi:hypothetical protein